MGALEDELVRDLFISKTRNSAFKDTLNFETTSGSTEAGIEIRTKQANNTGVSEVKTQVLHRKYNNRDPKLQSNKSQFRPWEILAS